jgi:hypothetical protein
MSTPMSMEFTKRELIGRHALGAGIGVGALALLAQTQNAPAQTAFTSFAFPATGGSIARTMPDRLSEVKNVKDFGAVGDGVTDDTAAIQGAVNARGNMAGVIFFPPGNYLISSPITFIPTSEAAIVFQGVGVASTIVGSFNDYLLKINGNTGVGECFYVQDLSLHNYGSSGGGVYFTGVIGAGVYRCKVQAFHGVTQDVYTEQFSCRDSTFFTIPGTPSGSWGVMTWGSGAVVDTCIFQGIDNCIRAAGGGFIFSNNRFEGNINTGMMLGMDASGNRQSVANCFVVSCTFEACSVGIDALTFSASSIENCQFNLTTNAPGGIGSYGIRIRAGSNYSIRNTGINQAGTNYSVAGLSIESQNLTAAIENTSFPSLKISDPRFSPIFINCGVPEGRQPTTYANKPVNPVQGLQYVFTDSTSNSFGATVLGGGTHIVVAVYGSDGAWRVTQPLSS